MGNRFSIINEEVLERCPKCGEPTRKRIIHGGKSHEYITPVRCSCYLEARRREELNAIQGIDGGGTGSASLKDYAEFIKTCPICGDALEARIKPGHAFSGKIIHSICRCESKIRDAKALDDINNARLRETLENRRRCFKDKKTAASSFRFDKRRTSDTSKLVRKYVDNFANMQEKGQGLLLHGPVGTGKSFYAACICNELLDRGFSCLFADMNQLIDMVDGEFQGKQERLDSLKQFDLIVIDDFGKERRGGYMDEQIIDIMDKIYGNYIPLIVTTNMNPADMVSDDDLFYQRVYSRIIEVCTPIEMRAKDQRRVAAVERNKEMTKLMDGVPV